MTTRPLTDAARHSYLVSSWEEYHRSPAAFRVEPTELQSAQVLAARIAAAPDAVTIARAAASTRGAVSRGAIFHIIAREAQHWSSGLVAGVLRSSDSRYRFRQRPDADAVLATIRPMVLDLVLRQGHTGAFLFLCRVLGQSRQKRGWRLAAHEIQQIERLVSSDEPSTLPPRRASRRGGWLRPRRSSRAGMAAELLLRDPWTDAERLLMALPRVIEACPWQLQEAVTHRNATPAIWEAVANHALDYRQGRQLVGLGISLCHVITRIPATLTLPAVRRLMAHGYHREHQILARTSSDDAERREALVAALAGEPEQALKSLAHAPDALFCLLTPEMLLPILEHERAHIRAGGFLALSAIGQGASRLADGARFVCPEDPAQLSDDLPF